MKEGDRVSEPVMQSNTAVNMIVCRVIALDCAGAANTGETNTIVQLTCSYSQQGNEICMTRITNHHPLFHRIWSRIFSGWFKWIFWFSLLHCNWKSPACTHWEKHSIPPCSHPTSVTLLLDWQKKTKNKQSSTTPLFSVIIRPVFIPFMHKRIFYSSWHSERWPIL